jgi:hypothetical protein
MVKVNRLTFVTFQINSLIDAGHKLSIEDTKYFSENKTLFTELEKRFPIKKTGFDLSILDEKDRNEILDFFSDMSLTYSEKEFGIINNGLCLIIAYAQEMIQRIMRDLYDQNIVIEKRRK